MFIRLSLQIGKITISLIRTDRGIYIHGAQLARFFGYKKPHDIIDTIDPHNYLNINSQYISRESIRQLVTTNTFSRYICLIDHINKL